MFSNMIKIIGIHLQGDLSLMLSVKQKKIKQASISTFHSFMQPLSVDYDYSKRK